MNEILIYDVIGADMFGEGVTAASVSNEIAALGTSNEIVVRINSAGGDVFEGFAIYNLLKQAKNKITVKVDGLAASAASVIAMAGDVVEMADNALIMIHNPMTMAFGGASDMVKASETLDKVKESIVSTYELRVELERDVISNMMDEETWMSAAEAINFGFADLVSGQGEPSVDNLNKPWMNKSPVVIKQEPVPAATPDFRIAARSSFPVL